MKPLATLDQFSDRLGVAPTGSEVKRAAAALEDASALVVAEAGRDWLNEHDDLVDVPPAIVAVTIDIARRIYRNPDGVTQTSVGDVSVSYSREGGASGAYLTRSDRAVIRRAVGRPTAGVVTLTTAYPSEVCNNG